MNASAIVALVTDGTQYWTELFQGDHPQGTLARHVDAKRWPSQDEARSGSPWWPAGSKGRKPDEDHARMHRALCSWSSCSHRVLEIAAIPA